MRIIYYVQPTVNSFAPDLRPESRPQLSLHLNKRKNRSIYDSLVCSISYSAHTREVSQSAYRFCRRGISTLVEVPTSS